MTLPHILFAFIVTIGVVIVAFIFGAQWAKVVLLWAIFWVLVMDVADREKCK